MADSTKPELRLALAMRGGVSLAVWIGGAVAEIDMVRRASNEALRAPDSDAQRFWKLLLDASPYSSVAADVLAGASAGGLNGVLYAASQIYDFPYDGMRRIWLEVGDTERLVRSGVPYPSLFEGDDYFMTEVERGLRELIGGRTGKLPPRPRVNLELSATSMEPIERKMPSPHDEPLAERRHASGFRFRHAAEPWLTSSFPATDGEQWFDAALRRLALAARATSSFPSAFEAATVVSTRRDTFGAPGPQPPAVDPVDLNGNFLDRSGTTSFVVADGGVLDNIPIRRALDAAVRAPADGPTRRVLLLLQPGSTSSAGALTTPAEPPPADQRTSTVAVLKGSLAARMSGETINADIQAIEAYNEGIRRAVSVRAGSFAWVNDPAGLLTLAEGAWPAYLQLRAQDDGRRTAELLRDPLGVLGYDPFPRSVAGGEVADTRWRSPIAEWASPDREGLCSALSDDLLARLQPLSPAPEGLLSTVADPEPLRRVVLLLLEWARHLETGPGQAQVGDLKRRLYRIHAFVEEALVGAAHQSWVATAARLPDDEAGSLASRVRDRAVRLFDVPPGDAAELIAALAADDGPLVAPKVREVYVRIDELVVEVLGGDVDTPAPPAPVLLTRLADELVVLAQGLHQVPAPPAGAGAVPSPGALLDRALRGPQPPTLRHLVALEVLCYSEFVAGLPGRRDVTFDRCSSENRTPLASHFEVLKPEGDPLPADRIAVDRKLAGNELANFSAFLLDRWRANDWLWGRLDAVVSLVDLLVTPEGLGAWLDGTGGDAGLFEATFRDERYLPFESAGDVSTWSSQLEAQIAAVAAAAPADRAGMDVSAVRDALIAQRQWEILRAEHHDELEADARKGKRPEPPAPTVGETRAWVAKYDIGTQTMTTPEHRGVLRTKVRDVAAVAMKAVVWNLRRGGLKAPAPWVVTGALWGLGPAVGRLAGRRLTQPKGTNGRRLALVLPPLAVLALAIAAVVDGEGPFGVAVAAVVLAVVGLVGLALLWVWRSARKAAREIDAKAAPPG